MKAHLVLLVIFFELLEGEALPGQAGSAPPGVQNAATGSIARDGGRKSPPGISNVASPITWARRAHQGFNMKVWLNNQLVLGKEAWDPFAPPIEHCASGIGLEYPADSCIEHLFGAGVMIGGIINGTRHVDEAFNLNDSRFEFETERKDTSRDRIWQTHTGDETGDPSKDDYSGYYKRMGIQLNRGGFDDDGDGRVDEDDLDGMDNDGDWSRDPVTHTWMYDSKGNFIDDIGSDGLPDSLEVSCDGQQYDPVLNPDPAFDNYDTLSFDKCHTDAVGNYIRKNDKNAYTQNNGVPDHGEPHVDEDFGAVSDKDYYSSATDTFRSFTVPGHVPMGIKVVMKSYAWDGDYARAILPFDYYFINIGQNIIHDVYVGFHVDADVGPIDDPNYAKENYTGYIPELRTAYTNNAVDRGSTPLGLTVLGLPKRLDSVQYVFQWHGFAEPGTIDSVIYTWMSGEAFPYLLVRPAPPFPPPPSDTRFLFSFGQKRDDPTPSKFKELKPGDTLKITVAFVSGHGLDEGPDNLRENAEHAIQIFRHQYRPPAIPPSPPLRLTRTNNSVTLDWKWRPSDPGIDPIDAWDDYNEFLNGFPDTSWRKIPPPCPPGALCYPPPGALNPPGARILEGYRVWRSESPVFDRQTFTRIAQFNIDPDPQFGYRTGLQYTMVDSNLRKGNTYWYAVTSYAFPDGVILAVPDSTGNTHTDTVLTQSSESNIRDNATQIRLTFGPSNSPGQVKVVPNPYYGDQQYTDGNGFEGAERTWTEDRRVIWFIDLPERATIRVYTLVGEVIATIEHDDARRSASGSPVGQEEWKLLSEGGRALASGIYLFSVESAFGKQIGKFAIIK